IRRLGTLTFGFRAPFYFIRAGSFVSVPALVAAPGVVGGLLLSKLVTKTFGLWPVTRFFRYPRTEAAYATLLMSTGLTFGSISALFGLTQRPGHPWLRRAPHRIFPASGGACVAAPASIDRPRRTFLSAGR